MKGAIPDAFLFADRCDNGKPYQASGTALEDAFEKREEGITGNKMVI